VNERDSYELRRIRRENEHQTNFMTYKGAATTGGAVLIFGLIKGGAFGILIVILGVVIMLLPLLITISISYEGIKDAKKTAKRIASQDDKESEE